MIALPTHHLEAEAQDQCPWCQQPIEHELFKEIEAKIKGEERKRMSAVEADLKGKFAAETVQTNAAWKTQLQAAKNEGATAVEAVKAAAKKQVDEFKAQEETIIAARVAEARKPLDAEKAALTTSLTTEKKAREAAQTELAAQKANQEAVVQTRVNEARAALEASHAKEKATADGQAFKEKQTLLGQVDDLKRKLEKKTNDELGDGAEVEVYDELRKAHPRDDIQRVKKGPEGGADIVHKILENGEVCGTIVYDSKNRTAWRNDYVVRLRKDKLAAKAEYAILATRVFPAGCKQLAVREGIILANPARVVALVDMLRTNAVHMAGLRLSAKEREGKMASLYDFITSDRCRQLFEQMEKVDDDMEQLDVDEKKVHDRTWEKRGTLIRSQQRARSTLASEIAAIVQAPRMVQLQKAK